MERWARPTLTRTNIGGHYWSTEDEREFLAHLGKWSAGRAPRAALLRRYLTTMRWRTDWGSVDPQVVRAALLKQLEEHGEGRMEK